MPALRRLPRVFLLGALVGAACSGAGGAPRDGGADLGTAAPATCQDIRTCALTCPDENCVEACLAKGASAAQDTFQALRACTANSCAQGDVACACGEQCLGDGTCLSQVDDCLGGAATDMICDSLCH